MPDISIQFHALPKELAPFISECAVTMGLCATAITFPPFDAREISTREIDQVVRDGTCRRLGLTVGKPSLPYNSDMDFLDQNPQTLILDIGRQTEAGLYESWLTSRITDAQINQLWQSIANKLRAMTSAGAVAVNPVTGATGPLRQHRFTKGALALYVKGIPILAVGGKTRLRLGDAPPNKSKQARP